MCQDCVKNKIEMTNGKTLYHSCSGKKISAYVDILKSELKNREIGFKVATGALAIGLILILIGFFNPVFFLFVIVVFVYGSMQLYPKPLKSEEQKALEGINTTLILQSKNLAGAYAIGALLGWIIRVVLFPIDYLLFIFKHKKAVKELSAAIEGQSAILERLQSA